MDICIELMISVPSDQDFINAGKSNLIGKWFEIGDIVCCYPATQMGTLQGNSYTRSAVTTPRKAYLFVRNVPINLGSDAENIKKINQIASSIWEESKQREWNLWADLNNNIKNTLLSTRYDTISFTQLKAALKSKATNQFFNESLL